MWERDSTQSKNPFTWLCLFSFRGLTGLKITSLAKCHCFNRNSRKSKIETVIDEFPKIQKVEIVIILSMDSEASL